VSALRKTELIDDSYFRELGGRAAIERVHVVFYDMLYTHPWLKGFFEGLDKTRLIAQQTDFMASVLGGPARFYGREPGPAHCHMFVTEEIFEVRHKLLGEAMEIAKLAPHVRAPWLKRDYAMKRALVKTSPAECFGRYKTEPIVVVPKP